MSNPYAPWPTEDLIRTVEGAAGELRYLYGLALEGNQLHRWPEMRGTASDLRLMLDELDGRAERKAGGA
jgi:hypothetical protein